MVIDLIIFKNFQGIHSLENLQIQADGWEEIEKITGLLQRDILSPILFITFTTDYFKEKGATDISRNTSNEALLLLLVDDPHSLQVKKIRSWKNIVPGLICSQKY